jgi:hypothetical protein
MQILPNSTYSTFPNEFVSRDEKETSEYGLMYAQAIWNSYIVNNGANYTRNVSNYEFLKSIASGRQSSDDIAGLLGYNGGQSGILSSRQIDIQLLNFGKMFAESAISKALRRQYNFTASIIDPSAVNAQKTKEAIIKAYFKVQEMAGDTLAKEMFPDIDTSILEETQEETLLKAQMSFSQELTLEADVAIKLLTDCINDFKEVRRQVVEDLVIYGIGGTKVYLDENKIPRLRRVNPMNFIYSQVDEPKLDKISYAGEIEFLSITDFARESAEYLTKEEQNNIVQAFGTIYPYFTFNQNGTYIPSVVSTNKYIPVLRFQFLSTNIDNFEVKSNKFGNSRIYRKDYTYNPTEEYKAKYPTRKVIRTSIVDKYGGCYVVGSPFIYNYRKVEAPVQNLVNKRLDYNMYAPSIHKGITTSIVSQMVEPLNMINLCHNRIKEIVGLGREGVLEIDTSMLSKIVLGNEAVKPTELLSLLDRDRILLTSSQDNTGELTVNNGRRAVNEIPIGLRMGDIAAIMDRAVSQLRQLTGVNPGLAAPEKGTGLGQTEIAVAAVDDSLGGLYHADQQIVKMTYDSLLGNFQVASMYGNTFEGMIDALGDGTVKFWETNNKVAFSNYGLYLELAPTEQQWGMLYGNMQKAVEQGFVTPAELMSLYKYKTFTQAEQMFILKERKGKRQAMQQAQANSQSQAEANMQATQAKMQADLQIIQAQAQADATLEQQKHQQKMEQLNLTIQGNIQVARVNADRNIEVQNKANFGKLTNTELANRAKLKIKNANEQKLSNTIKE